MLIKTFKINLKIVIIILIFTALLCSIFAFYSLANETEYTKKDFIKWVDFNVSSEALKLTANLDIKSHNENQEIKYNWIELLSYLACKNGGDFKGFKRSDLDNLVCRLKDGETIESLTQNLKFYDYYYESYSAVLSNFIGNYSVETSNGNFVSKYGVKAFLPIAKNYSFSHYDDFGNSRSYGFKRTHLGNDLLRKYWNSYCSCRRWNCRAFRLEPIWWMENWN